MLRASLLFLLAATIPLISALTFDLGYGSQKCFSEDVAPSTLIKGSVSASGGKGGADMKLDVYVSNAQGVVAFHRTDVNAVKFSFSSGAFERHTTQPYRICVMHQITSGSAYPPSGKAYRRVTLSFEQATKVADTTALATRQHVDQVHQSFHEVSVAVDRLIEAMDDLRAKEQDLTDVNQDTTSVIVRISIVACLATILTGVLNFLSLKTFFKQKKLA